MSTQRNKVKSLPRIRSQRLSVNPSNFTKPCNNGTSTQDTNSLFSNSILTYLLGRHCIGNIGEVTTTKNDKVLGVIKAISPYGDVGLGYAYTSDKCKKENLTVNALLVSHSQWKIVRIPNVTLNDCLLVDSKIETESNIDSDSTPIVPATEELVPYFGSSDAIKDCLLDQGGFPAEEMFKTNKELFSVSTTYNPDLIEYTTPVDRNAPNFSETEARCDKLARDIEGNQSTAPIVDEACDDEELAFSAVVRPNKEQSTCVRVTTRSTRGSSERDLEHSGGLKNATKPTPRISNAPTKLQTLEKTHNNDDAQTRSTNSAKVDIQAIKVLTDSGISEVSSDTLTNGSIAPTTHNSDILAVTSSPTHVNGEKTRKSTLDPNAPEFQPMSLQYAYTPPTLIQPSIHHAVSGVPFSQFVHPTMNANQTGQLSMPALAALVAAPQTQLYAAPTMPYVSHSGPLPPMLPTALSAPVANSIAQQMRGASLPPSMHQGFSASLNPTSGLLIQHTHPGMSLQQVHSQTPLVAVPNSNGRFVGPSVSFSRQRSTEPTSTTSHTTFGPSQCNMSVSLPSPVYQFSQAAGGIPLFFTGHPQMGLHIVPGSGGSSAVMVGNLPMSQSSGQSIYPTQAMLHMQPAQMPMPGVQMDQSVSVASTQQQQPVFHSHAGQLPENPHHIQLSQYAPNVLFAPHHNMPSNYYPSGPHMLTSAGLLNSSLQAGLLPVVNQSNAQLHSGGPVGHQASSMDSFLSSQLQQPFPHPSCQPSHLQHYAAQSQFFHAQQLSNAQHISSQSLQPSFHTFNSLVTNASQTH